MAMKWYWLSADGPGSPRIAGTYVRTQLTGFNATWVLDFFCIFGQNVWAKHLSQFLLLYFYIFRMVKKHTTTKKVS